MKREKKLAINTILFAISNFGSKAIAFFLVPLYTALLTKEQYGTVDLIVTANSLLLPLITVSMADAVLRFAIDDRARTADIFVTGMSVVFLGNVVGVFIVPFIGNYLEVNNYWMYSALILVFNSLYSVTAQFCRGISRNIQFAMGGIVQTVVLVTCNIVFLLFMGMKIEGYFLSLILSYTIAFVFLFVSAKLYVYLKGYFCKELCVEMVKYALPLIPNAILWWIMNASDKFFIARILGKDDNGIYAVANKFPSIINIISVVFFQAWQLSAIEEAKATDKNEYYSKVFWGLSSVIVLAISFILMVLKPVFSVWTSDAYYDAWKYSWMLLFAVMFMCFSSFWGSNLLAAKRSKSILKSAIVGAGINIILNAILIPISGLYGAAFATIVGFLLMWIVRNVESKKYFEIRIENKSFIINILILLVQALLLYSDNYLYYEIILFLILIVVNWRFISFVTSSMKSIVSNVVRKRKQ